MKHNDKKLLFWLIFIIPGIAWLAFLYLLAFNNFIGFNILPLTNCLIFACVSTLIAVVIFTIILLVYRKKEKDLQQAILNSNISQVDDLSPFEFEEWVARVFRIAGYEAQATKKSGDYGVDVLATKDNIKIAVQVKKFSQPVGIKAVQEIISGMDYYNCDEGWVISTAPYFTQAAKNLAQTRNIKLCNKKDLIFMLDKLKRYNKTDLTDLINH